MRRLLLILGAIFGSALTTAVVMTVLLSYHYQTFYGALIPDAPTALESFSFKEMSAQDLLSTFNTYRTTHHLKTVKWDDTLCQFANERLPEIQTDWSHNGFWAHYPLFHKTYPRYVYMGENLAKGFYTAPETMTAWDNSPEHHANLVNTHYTSVCFSTNGDYTVQILGGS